MAKIAISLPDPVLETIERERKASGESRSEFFRRAVEDLLRRERERELDAQYIRGYQQYPETAEEIAITESTLAEALADNPWEGGTAE
jgi:metal-responsive CopG/Arc/MetJ family transcriptional regulator